MNSLRSGSALRGLLGVAGANGLVVVLSSVAALVMPLALSVEGYAHWQWFSLLSGLIGFFFVGHNDGFYLRYAGRAYGPDLFPALRSFRRMNLTFGLIGSLVIILVGLTTAIAPPFTIGALAVFCAFFGLLGMNSYIFQTTVRLGDYAVSLVVEKVTFVACVMGFFFLGVRDTRAFIAVFVVCGGVRLVYGCARTWDIGRVPKWLPIVPNPAESAANIRSGFVLMCAVLLTNVMLYPGRLLVESRLGLRSFGIFSFGLTAVTLFSVCLVAVSQAIFPVMQRLSSRERLTTYGLMEKSLVAGGALVLGGYGGLALVIELVYTEYVQMLEYLVLLLPIFLFQAKNTVIVLNYLRISKALGLMLASAAMALICNFLGVASALALVNSETAAAWGTLAGVACWATFWWLWFILKVGSGMSGWTAAEPVLIAAFLAIHIGLGGILNMAERSILYGVLLAVLGFLARASISSVVREFRRRLLLG